jgi:hypothetical protein
MTLDLRQLIVNGVIGIACFFATVERRAIIGRQEAGPNRNIPVSTRQAQFLKIRNYLHAG